jgi:hypothetical protein
MKARAGNRLSAGCAQKNLHEKSPSDTSARAFIFIQAYVTLGV